MRYEMVIVGGGLVGAGLACALRETGWQVALIDARLPSQDDPRLIALHHGSCQFLKNQGLWESLKQHASPIHEVHVSHQGCFGTVRLKREDLALSALGYVIPAKHIEASLQYVLMTLPNLHLFRPAKFVSMQQEKDQVVLEIDATEGKKIIKANYVIAADGTQSAVRAALRIPTDIIDYEQSAIVTRTTLTRSHHDIAYERFYAKGAIAMLPLLHNQCATIWSADHATISQLMHLNEEDFLEALQKEFGFRLGRLKKITGRSVFPLKKICAEKMVQGSVILLGNAAHTLHPIAAQGFNLALYEVQILIESILERIKNHEAFTAQDLHKASERMQKQKSLSLRVSHELTHLFSGNFSLKKKMAQIGMIGFDYAPFLKKRFLRHMLGLVDMG